METFGVQPAEAMMGEEQQPQQQKQDDRKNIPCRFWKAGTIMLQEEQVPLET